MTAADVDTVLLQRPVDFRPLFAICRIYRARPQVQAFGGLDLISHQRQKRRDNQRRSARPIPQQPRRDEIDEALSPPGPLHDEQALAPVRQRVDGLELAVPKFGRFVVQGLP